MFTKNNIDISAKSLRRLERFLDPTGKSLSYVFDSTTTVLEMDMSNYSDILTEGMFSLAKKITLNEFLCLSGAFNDWFLLGRTTPKNIKSQIREYIHFDDEFAINCKEMDIDKENLLNTVNELCIAECYSLLDYSRRLWNVIGELTTDCEKLHEINLFTDMFKQAS